MGLITSECQYRFQQIFRDTGPTSTSAEPSRKQIHRYSYRPQPARISHLSQQTQIHHTRKTTIICQAIFRKPIENTLLEPLMRGPQLYHKPDIFINVVEEPMHGVKRHRFGCPQA
jgi:hypothetical protein